LWERRDSNPGPIA